MDFIFVFKVISGILAGLIATLICLEKKNDDIPNDQVSKNQLINKLKKTTIYSIIAVWISFGTSVTLDFITIKNNMAKEEQNKIETKRNNKILKNIQFNTFRLPYPIEPLTLEYEIEYSMNHDVFKDYINRMVVVLESEYKRSIDSLNFTVILSTKGRNWMPNKNEKAFDLLNEDWTSFNIRNANTSLLRFLSYPSYTSEAIVHKKTEYKLHQEIIEVSADFFEKIIYKKVKVYNPLRTGNDQSSISSLDLIGRYISWNMISNLKVTAQLHYINFICQNQFKDSKRIENIRNSSVDSTLINFQNIGLEEIGDLLNN